MQSFLATFVPFQSPPTYQLVADQLAERFSFRRDRESVAVFDRSHFLPLVRALEAVPKPKRRWERAGVGELWQHDSSIHQWWPGNAKQTLLLTVDDHARKYRPGIFVSSNTTWHHFEHFRSAFVHHGCPLAISTDGLALFVYKSTTDGRDPRSEFQWILTALDLSHFVAPSPLAKGKSERRFGTLPKRMVTLLACEKIADYGPTQSLLNHELERQNLTTCRTTGLSPNEAWSKASLDKRNVLRPPTPAS